MKAVGAVVAAIVLVAVVVVGGWQLGWWLKEESTNRTTSIANDSVARQQALVDDVVDKAATISEIDAQITFVTPEQAQSLSAQRAAVVDQFCQSYGGLTGRLSYPASIDALASQECN